MRAVLCGLQHTGCPPSGPSATVCSSIRFVRAPVERSSEASRFPRPRSAQRRARLTPQACTCGQSGRQHPLADSESSPSPSPSSSHSLSDGMTIVKGHRNLLLYFEKNSLSMRTQSLGAVICHARENRLQAAAQTTPQQLTAPAQDAVGPDQSQIKSARKVLYVEPSSNNVCKTTRARRRRFAAPNNNCGNKGFPRSAEKCRSQQLKSCVTHFWVARSRGSFLLFLKKQVRLQNTYGCKKRYTGRLPASAQSKSQKKKPDLYMSNTQKSNETKCTLHRPEQNSSRHYRLQRSVLKIG